jgi:ATP-dependent protease ClpP protease subunit
MGEVIPKISRPGPARTVKISGPLTVAAAKRTIAAIRRLARVSVEPIVLHIQSGGGEVEAFYQLTGVMENLRVHGEKCKVFTLARNVRSAATYLLLAGHRAYVLPDAQLGLHGTRGALPKNGQLFTRETALAMAMRLDRENRSVARILAKRIIFRVAARQRELRPPHARPATQTPLVNLEKLTNRIAKRLTSAQARRLLQESFERLKLVWAVSTSFPTEPRILSSSILAAQEAKIFQAVIGCELAANRGKEWRLDATAGAELLMDYLLAKDFLPGGHLKLAERIARKFGRDYLSAPAAKVYARLQRQSPAQAEAFLIKTTLPHALGLWYFTMTLCHRLLAGDYDLSAQDAYWLGLVDEVLPAESPSLALLK